MVQQNLLLTELEVNPSLQLRFEKTGQFHENYENYRESAPTIPEKVAETFQIC